MSKNKLIQEITTRWWSILRMLLSIINNLHPVVIALTDANRSSLVLKPLEINRIKEIIGLLQIFKSNTEMLGVQSDITITLIIPIYKIFKDTLSTVGEKESPMLKSMKGHMLNKLKSRYSEAQLNYLAHCTYLDPRFKKSVNPNLRSLTEKVKDIALTFTDTVSGTQSQNLQNIQKPSFSNTTREKPSSSNSTNVNLKKPYNNLLFVDDDSEEETETSSDDLSIKISRELDAYARITLKSEQKQKINLISWWQDRKGEFPHLFKTVRAILCTPATSVPCESVFSEAGYMARAKRSLLSPDNLNKYLFIKKNRKHLPKDLNYTSMYKTLFKN